MKTLFPLPSGKIHIYIIVIIFLLCTYIHYPEFSPLFLKMEVLSNLGLERHALIRILFLIPIIYSIFVYGLVGGFISLFISLILMIPRIYFISPHPKDAVFETISILIIGFLINIWIDSRSKTITKERELQENLRLYTRQLNSAHEDERKSIARDLHDDVIQNMISAGRNLDNLLSSDIPVGHRLINKLDLVQKDIERSVSSIRNFIQYLRPPILEFLGLIPALRELFRQVEKESDISITFLHDDISNNLNEEKIVLIYRILQEILRNIQKHSCASEVNIILKSEEKNIGITVYDNGIGFENIHDKDLLKSGKSGIVGMRERALLLGGTLEISSAIKNGTIIRLVIPYGNSVC